MADTTTSGSRRPKLPIAPFVTFLGAWTVLWWGIVGAIAAPRIPGGWATIVLAAIAGLAPLGLMIRNVTRGGYPSAAMRLFVVRPFWYLQLALPVVALAGITGVVLGLFFGAPRAGGQLAMVVMLALGVLAGLAGYAGSRRLVVKRLDVRIDELPPALDGMVVAQLSDTHVGPHTSRRFLARARRAVESARPDVIVVTGDQVDDYVRDTEPFAAALGGLAAPLGAYAIPGNHDVYAGWEGVRAGLERAGLTVLVNDAAACTRGGTRFWIAGTGDPAGGRGSAGPDLARTLAKVPAGEWVLVLAHNPALWPALAQAGVPLTLSGHTHYGQLAIPALGWSLASPFLAHAMGAHEVNGRLLYINPGTNYWGIPFRLGARPEVTILTLRRGDGSGARIEVVSTTSA